MGPEQRSPNTEQAFTEQGEHEQRTEHELFEHEPRAANTNTNTNLNTEHEHEHEPKFQVNQVVLRKIVIFFTKVT